jgi:hypothetical protein
VDAGEAIEYEGTHPERFRRDRDQGEVSKRNHIVEQLQARLGKQD